MLKRLSPEDCGVTSGLSRSSSPDCERGSCSKPRPTESGTAYVVLRYPLSRFENVLATRAYDKARNAKEGSVPGSAMKSSE